MAATITYTRAARLGVAAAHLGTFTVDEFAYDVAIERADERFMLTKPSPAERWTVEITGAGQTATFYAQTVTAAKGRVKSLVACLGDIEWDDAALWLADGETPDLREAVLRS